MLRWRVLVVLGPAFGIVPNVLVSCAPKEHVIVNGVVGPSPTSQSSLSQGRLGVYTDTPAIGYDQDRLTSSQSPFWLLTNEGQPIEQYWGGSSSSPEWIALAAGDYVIRGDGLSGRLVDIRVRVFPGKTTEVHLDGSWRPSPGVAANQIVVGPDGSYVGWRADLPGAQTSLPDSP